MTIIARAWRNPSWMTVAAYMLLAPYLWLQPPQAWSGWLLVAFLVLVARADVIRSRRCARETHDVCNPRSGG